MNVKGIGTVYRHGAKALTLCALLVLTWGCGSGGDGGDKAECDNGETSTKSCGAKELGTQKLLCVDYQWQNDGACIDDSNCFGENDSFVRCGLNNAGNQWRTCVSGQWVDEGICYNADVCITGTNKFGACDAPKLGRVDLVCARGQWIQEKLGCDESTACTTGETEELGCGINKMGTLIRTCENGAWSYGECDDTDECINAEETTMSCGSEGLGSQDYTCLQGQWVEDRGSVCEIPKVCVPDVDSNERACPSDSSQRQFQYCTEDGQWGEWEPCGNDLAAVCEDDPEPREMICGDDESGWRFSACIDGQYEEPCQQTARGILGARNGFFIEVFPDLDTPIQDRSIYATGNNDHRQLGLGENHPLEETGAVFYGVVPLLTEIPYSTYASADERGNLFSASTTHACALHDDAPYCWGDNAYGQIGIDPAEQEVVSTPHEVSLELDEDEIVISVAVGEGFSCALTSDQRVYCWGYAEDYQLGNSWDESTHEPQQVEVPPTLAISAGNAHVCAVIDGVEEGELEEIYINNVYCWGKNDQQQSASHSEDTQSGPQPYFDHIELQFATPQWYIDRTGPDQLYGERHEIVNVYAAGDHTVVEVHSEWTARTSEAEPPTDSETHTTLFGFGYNRSSVLGPYNGDGIAPGVVRTAHWSHEDVTHAEIYARPAMTCVLQYPRTSSQRELKCLGANHTGLIDGEGNAAVDSLTEIYPAFFEGNIRQAAISDDAICVLDEFTQRVFCRGAGAYGQLGHGTTNDSFEFTPMLHASEISQPTAVP